MEKLVEVTGNDSLSLEQVIECRKVLGFKIQQEPPADFKESIEEANKQLQRMHKVN
jgi:hypothetical protein